MKIAVNTRLLLKNKLDGIGWFTFHTLKRLTEQHKEVDFYFLFDRKYDKRFIFGKNVKPIIVAPPTRHAILWWIWLKISVPLVLQKIKPDIFLSPDGFLPFTKKIKKITVIHDINFAHNPHDLPFFSRLFYIKYFPIFAQNADQIATVSTFSKKDIVETYKIDENKIEVVYNGSDEIYKPINEEQKHETKQKYTQNEDYFIFVGSIHPRKNVKRLILSFEKFKKKSNSKVKLVIVGAKFFKNTDLLNTYESLKFKDEIIFTGRLEPEELHKVLASALSLIFVPYFEGFGIPLIEAMNCDVPIISANVTSMPEVAGEAAFFVNPFDIDEIAEAMQKIANDKNLRSQLIEKGKIQRQKFSWDKTAEKIWQIISETNKM